MGLRYYICSHCGWLGRREFAPSACPKCHTRSVKKKTREN